MKKIKLTVTVQKGNTIKDLEFYCHNQYDVDYWRYNVETLGGWKILYFKQELVIIK